MAKKLKVFQTSTGFHNAFVAAPSRAAALRAWGSSIDLFARGVAFEVTDPALMVGPLARPGEVVRVSRGSLTKQLAALPSRDLEARNVEAGIASRANKPSAPKREPKSREKPTPRPGRGALDRALAQAERLRRHHQDQLANLAKSEAKLRDKRIALQAQQSRDKDRAQQSVADARNAYESALEKWRVTN